jgi:hypothetical protein
MIAVLVERGIQLYNLLILESDAVRQGVEEPAQL